MNWSANLAWRIEVTDTAKKQLAKFDRQVQLEIMRYLREKIATEEDPRLGWRTVAKGIVWPLEVSGWGVSTHLRHSG